MIRSSGFAALASEIEEARRLTNMIADLRAKAPGDLLDLHVGTMTLGFAMPVGMAIEGLVKQLRLVVQRLAAGGVQFDEGNPDDLPPPPAKRGRKARAVAA
jgi:hypothetical protein